jgi:hypothetical protein
MDYYRHYPLHLTRKPLCFSSDSLLCLVVADPILLHAFKKTTAAWGKGEE